MLAYVLAAQGRVRGCRRLHQRSPDASSADQRTAERSSKRSSTSRSRRSRPTRTVNSPSPATSRASPGWAPLTPTRACETKSVSRRSTFPHGLERAETLRFELTSTVGLRQIPWLRLVELAPGRLLLSIPSGTPVESLEIAVHDLLETVSTAESRERAILEGLHALIRRLRRGRSLSKAEMLFVDMRSQAEREPEARGLPAEERGVRSGLR